jgi:transposase
MSGVSKAISDELFLQAQTALKELGKTGKISRKLQAIIAAKKFGVSMDSEIFETSRQSLMTWIKNFEKDYKKGLEIKNGQGRKPITNATVKDSALQIMQKNPNTTNAELRQIIQEKHSVSMSESTANRLVKQLGLSYIRPIHHKIDISSQDDFKKNSKKLPKNRPKKGSFSLMNQGSELTQS